MGCDAVSYSNVTIHTPETSTVSIEQLSISGNLEVYCDVSAEVDVEGFRCVVGQNGKLVHCGIMFCSLTNMMRYVFYILVTFRPAIGP